MLKNKIFDQFVIDNKFLIKLRDTVRYITKSNMRGCDTVKDDGSNVVSDNEPNKSRLKENEDKVKTRVCLSACDFFMGIDINGLRGCDELLRKMAYIIKNFMVSNFSLQF